MKRLLIPVSIVLFGATLTSCDVLEEAASIVTTTTNTNTTPQ
ncbi:MAG: hypothetical protein RI922_64, partial [Bacteroidota bacterium]